MKKAFIIFISILSVVAAANNAGDFLNNNKTARAQGLGNAFSALADDQTAIFYNPAGLADQKDNTISLQNNDLWGVNYLIFASSFDWKNERIGIGVLNGSVGGIRESKLDDTGNPYFTGKTFSWAGRAVYLSWGKEVSYQPLSSPHPPTPLSKPGEEGTVTNSITVTTNLSISKNIVATEKISIVTENLSTAIEQETNSVSLGKFGATIKLINEDLYDSQAYGYGVDVGYLYDLSEKIDLSVMIENLLRPQLAWNTDDHVKETVPLNLKFGTTYRMTEQLTLLAELSKKDDRDAQLQGGAEYWLFKQDGFGFAVRGGLEPKAGSLGLSLIFNSLNIDYSYTNSEYSEDLGQTHRVAVGWKL